MNPLRSGEGSFILLFDTLSFSAVLCTIGSKTVRNRCERITNNDLVWIGEHIPEAALKRQYMGRTTSHKDVGNLVGCCIIYVEKLCEFPNDAFDDGRSERIELIASQRYVDVEIILVESNTRWFWGENSRRFWKGWYGSY